MSRERKHKTEHLTTEELFEMTQKMNSSQICLSLFKCSNGKNYKRLARLLKKHNLELPKKQSGSNQHCRLKGIEDLIRASENDEPMTNRQYRKLCFYFASKNCYHHSICGVKMDKNIQVHHIDRNKKNNRPINLMPLCSKCHYDFHNVEGDMAVDYKNIENKYVEKIKTQCYDYKN